MEKFWSAILDANGDPVSEATITVYLAGTTTIASIYTDSEGLIPKDNPFTSDTYGRFSFYAADTRYDIKVEKTGLISYIIYNVVLRHFHENKTILDSISEIPQRLSLDEIIGCYFLT